MQVDSLAHSYARPITVEQHHEPQGSQRKPLPITSGQLPPQGLSP